MVRSLWGNSSFMHTFSPSRGAFDSVLFIWDLDSISHNRVFIHDGFVAIEVVWVRSALQVLFIAVYAPQGLNNKILLQNEIYNTISNFSGEYIVMGDFNEVRDDSEILGSNFNMSFVRVFNDFIDSLDLVDIPLGGA